MEAVGEQGPEGDQLLWEVEAISGGRRLTRVDFAAQPSGFRGDDAPTLLDLENGYLDALLAVHARTDRGDLISTFTLAELPTDGMAVLQGPDDHAMSVSALRQAQRDECSPSSTGAWVAIALLSAVTTALLLRARSDWRHKRSNRIE